MTAFFMDIKKIYNQLLKKYGKQGWWPVFVPTCVGTSPGKPPILRAKVRGKPVRFEFGLCYGIPYSGLNKFKTLFRDPYFEIAVGAILTQNTAWKNVARAIINLYNAKALTPQRILKLPTSKLQRLIRPAGYFRQKSKKLRLFADWIIRDYGGDILQLKKLRAYGLRLKLLGQWGIGPETADSILLYALNKPIFVVDEYTRRLCRKYDVEFKKYDEYRQLFEKQFSAKPCIHAVHGLSALFREFHGLIVASQKW